MRVITVVPGAPDRTRLEERPEPPENAGAVLVESRLLGICGTDVDIVQGGYGTPPPGAHRLVPGHESLGLVREAPPDSGLAPGDAVAGIVRRPDPVPCTPCAAGDWDFCRNGRYTERGIKELDGFAAELWRTDPEYAVRLEPALGDCGVLVEPASVLAKAWEQVNRIVARSSSRPHSALITGAGPIGLLAALMSTQQGLDTHVLELTEQGPKPALVRDLGGTFHTGDARDLGLAPDVVIECTGQGPLVFELCRVVAPNAVICLAGVSSGGRTIQVSADALNKELVLENTVIFGTVNAARRHYEQAAAVLARADRHWLERLLTRRVPMSGFARALDKGPADIKPVVDPRS